ncbi:trypsin-like serine peptidase [Streptomyces sp. NPDC059985]|uniref:trypsin-like serine peptidase n=1 Tax=Streptomyces sp. NPDC059985 TaxID=3347025 RepID=UPI0036871C78
MLLISAIALSFPQAGKQGTGDTLNAQAGLVGALFRKNIDGGHFCTASIVHSPHSNLIATAAHCLAPGDDSVFVPAYSGGRTAHFGVWSISHVFTPPAWRDAHDPDADYAFAALRPLSGKNIEQELPGLRLAASSSPGQEVTVIGYPKTHDTPLHCSAIAGAFGPGQLRVDCPNFTGGTSGSPWIGPAGKLVGVLGGHEGGGTTPDVSYSPVLGEQARHLYQQATA